MGAASPLLHRQKMLPRWLAILSVQYFCMRGRQFRRRKQCIREHVGEQRFFQFLERLQAVIPSGRIVLVGYSMGNRLLYSALRQRYFSHGLNSDFPKYRAVIFGCADVNVDEFAADQDQVAFNGQVCITKNNFDEALTLSQIQRGFYGRLGAPRTALKKLLKNEAVDVYGIEEVMGKSHGFPFQIVSDVIRKQEGNYMVHHIFAQKKPHLFHVSHL